MRNPNNFLLTLLKAIYLFIPGILLLIAYYFIIIEMPIGQDMLLQAGENPGPFIWTIVGILIWMLFSWYSSRLISDAYVAQCTPPHQSLFIHFPRLIGYNVAICLQLAILNLPTVAALSKGVIVLLIAHNLFYILLDRAMLLQTKKLFAVCFIIALSYLVYLGYVYMKATDLMHASFYKNTHLKSFFSMLLIFFTFQIVFVALVVWRRKQLARGKFADPLKNWRNGYNILAGLAIVLYIIILESSWFANRFGGLGVTLLAFGIWIGFICLVKKYSIKLNVRFGLPLLALAIIYGIVLKNPYKVRLQKTPLANLYSNRPGIDSFLHRWIHSSLRDGEIQKADSNHRFNVYMIIADGGASKSGYWVAAVLSKLEDVTSSGDKFSNHILSLAGASGGSVGNAAFYCLLRESLKGRFLQDSIESMNFFEGDFFTSSFARFLGPDLFRHIIPFIPMDDRAAVLEQSMEQISESKVIGDDFKGNLDTILDYKGDLPALFINTTNLQSGSPGIVSNIRLDAAFTERMDILQLLDTTEEITYNNNMKLSTAVILGARFPYISPAGDIHGKYFVDGGYFDNSGGGITLEMIQYIENKMNNPKDSIYTQLKNKLNFKVIYISNGNNEPSEDHGLNPFVNDLAAPLLTVAGTYGRQTSLSNKKLEIFMRSKKFYTTQNSFETINLPMVSTKIDSIPYPMNWVISDFNLDRMQKNLNYVYPAEILK